MKTFGLIVVLVAVVICGMPERAAAQFHGGFHSGFRTAGFHGFGGYGGFGVRAGFGGYAMPAFGAFAVDPCAVPVAAFQSSYSVQQTFLAAPAPVAFVPSFGGANVNVVNGGGGLFRRGGGVVQASAGGFGGGGANVNIVNQNRGGLLGGLFGGRNNQVIQASAGGPGGANVNVVNSRRR